MSLTDEAIEQQLADLEQAVPRLLAANHGPEFWIEFLDRADAIRARVPLDRCDGLTERIDALLTKFGIAPPSRWIIEAATHG